MNRGLTVSGVAALAVLVLPGTAEADLAGVYMVDLGDVGGGESTYRVFVQFDAPDDQLLAVGGLPGVAPLAFSSTSPLLNSAGAFDGLIFEDAPFEPISAAWDSWLSIGGPAAHDTQFSPGFAGGDGVLSVVHGTSFSEADGGYFDGNPGTPTGGAGWHVIAQFTTGGQFSFSGVVTWRDDTLPGGAFFATEFLIQPIPAPGVLALAAMGSGAARGRRRRGRPAGAR